MPLLLVLALACRPSNPKYSEEITGREEVHPGDDAASTTQAARGGGGGGSSASARGGSQDEQAPVDCGATHSAPVKGGITGPLTCGATIEGTTEGGSNSFGDRFYQQAFCTPARRHYDDAPEAIYRFEVPADVEAIVTLDSPCADLDLAAVFWIGDSLPTAEQTTRVRECEMDTATGGGKVQLTTVNKVQPYLIIVDGKEGDTADFRLSVSCRTYR